jgi:metal-sulfur cluster biosynthetic enzyme
MEGTQITHAAVVEVMKEVYDPEIPINVVDLGLVYDVSVQEGNVHVLMTLTAPGCGMGPFIAQQAEWAIAELEGVSDVEVEMTFDPPWNPEMISEDGKKLLGID